MASKIPQIDYKVDIHNLNESSLGLLKLVLPHLPAEAPITLIACKNGITNTLLKAEIAGHAPRLIRIYGHKSEVIIDRLAELQTFALLGELGLAEKVEARFSNGFVCGWVEGSALVEEDGSGRMMVEYYEAIAAEMAKWHATIPLHTRHHGNDGEMEGYKVVGDGRDRGGKPTLLPTLSNWFNAVLSSHSELSRMHESTMAICMQTIKEYLRFASESLEKFENAPNVAFCHNDLLSANIIKVKAADDCRKGKDGCRGDDDHKEAASVRFIDFEYASVNYCAFEIANHFCEYAGFECDYENLFPDLDHQSRFISAYTQSYHHYHPSSNTSTSSKNNNPKHAILASQNTLTQHVEFFVPLSHLFWCLWACLQSIHSQIAFDYAGYALKRYQAFIDTRKTN